MLAGSLGGMSVVLLIIIILYLYSADYITMSKSALQVPKIIIVIIISNLY